ncbi:hypothetical protein NQZ68_028865 [Dissostichus eleginoides]|nr:hypothetical protein NQZ68_028865 [Dissostichus eleginoides]
MSLVEEVKALRLENSEKEKRIFSLENRVDELEQYTRINNIRITGLETKSRSYARAATRMTGGDTSEEDATSVELQVTAFLNSKGIEIDSDNIEASPPLPRRNKTDKPAIIIRELERRLERELERELEKRLERGLEKELERELEKRRERGLEKGLGKGLGKRLERGLKEGLGKGLEKGPEKGLEKGPE